LAPPYRKLRGVDRFDGRKLAGSFVAKLVATIAPKAASSGMRADGSAQRSHADSGALRLLENSNNREATTTWRRSAIVNCTTTFRLY
jgi:hypothetical protein